MKAVARPVGAEARGRVRIWKKALSENCDRLMNAVARPAVKDGILAMVHRNSAKGKHRAFTRVIAPAVGQRAIPIVLRLDRHSVAVWAFLDPFDEDNQHLNRPARNRQAGVAISYMVMGCTMEGPGLFTGHWTINVTDHALGRVLERDPGADLNAVLLAAHQTIIGSSHTKWEALASNERRPGQPFSVLVAAGNGAFVCDMGFTDEDEGLIWLVARTWLHRDQLFEAQDRAVVLPAAMSADDRLGDDIMLPAPFRRIERDTDGGAIVDVWDHAPLLEYDQLAATALARVAIQATWESLTSSRG